MSENPNRPDNAVKCWCNKCRSDTIHTVETEHVTKVPGMIVHGNEMNRSEHYMVVTCRGCEEIHFLKVTIGSEDVIWTMGYEHPFDCPTLQENYPPRNYARSPPDWIEQIEPSLRVLLKQTYMALHMGADRLVAMGTRAALEQTIVEKCGDQGSFEKNISKFVERGFLAQANRDAVMAALDVGSAAIHRGYRPDLEALVDVFEIVESAIHAVYIVPESGKRRSEVTPKRISRPRRS